MTDAATEKTALQSAQKRQIVYPIVLIITGVIGWYAAFQLTIEKIAHAANPTEALSCDISVLVQCGKNLDSWQGSLLGFPNPILGLTGWVAPIVVGAAILAGARFARWFRIVFNLGIAGAMALVIFLIYTSIFSLGTLCPWCMLTWLVTFPIFWLVTLGNLRDGTIALPPRLKAFAGTLYEWSPAITIGCYLVVVVFAQIYLNALGSILNL